MSARIDHVVTAGVFSLDGEDFEVENNIWIVGDDREVVVIDAAHDHRPILERVAGRKVNAIVCTHAHNDHINAAAELAGATGAPILLHPDDAMLWEVLYPDRRVDVSLGDGDEITVAGSSLEVLHTPGHSPGGVCLHLGSEGVLFSGDTLFNGGPGATGRSFSDRALLEQSIRTRLFTLPGDTLVNTGHGESTTVSAEQRGASDW
ncbi:MAG: MBL fold metallo-hydrolase [Microthrixaceae bacterium]|nr:MBL fold metallo-hydrolase [Microthrixaceae bacterium]